MLAVRRKHAVESCQVHSGLGNQGGESGHEIQRLKDDMRTLTFGVSDSRCSDIAGRLMLPAQAFQLPAFIGPRRNARVQ